jgi:hypothetical protein
MDIFTAAGQAYKNGYEKGSKETAAKLIAKIKQALTSIEIIVDNDTHKWQPDIGYNVQEVDDLLDELANQFSVE